MKARKMRSWRNWQTRKTKDLVGNSMQVQFLSTAPKKRKLIKFNLRFLFFLSLNIKYGKPCNNEKLF